MFLFSCLHAFIPPTIYIRKQILQVLQVSFFSIRDGKEFSRPVPCKSDINSLTRFRKLETGKGCCTLYAVCMYKFLYIPDLYEPCFLSYLCVSVTYKVMPVHIMDKTEQLS